MKKREVVSMYDLDLDVANTLRSIDLAFRSLPVERHEALDNHVTQCFMGTIGNLILDTLAEEMSMDDPNTLDTLEDEIYGFMTTLFEEFDILTIDDESFEREKELTIAAEEIYISISLLIEAFHSRYNYEYPPWLEHLHSVSGGNNYRTEFIAGYRVLAIIDTLEGEGSWI